MSSRPAPTRTLPNKPSLAQLRKQAKELLKSYRDGKEAAVAEVEQFERSPDPAKFALADAQRVLARAYGFSSWAALKDHVEGVNFRAFLASVEAGDVAAVRRIAKVRPDLIDQHAPLHGGALHRAVLRRNEELTRVLMQLGANARAGIWPHRDATSPYAIAVDREYNEIVAVIEREEENRRARFGHDGAPASAAVEALQQAIAELLLARGADVNAVVYACGDSICAAEDEKMKALLRKHGARLTVETVTDPKTAQAILDGSVTAYALGDAEPLEPKDAAERLCGGDPEFIRICLPQITRKRDDPWWHSLLRNARAPEGLKLVLDCRIDPDLPGEGGYTILHHLATPVAGRRGSFAPAEEECLLRATMLLDAGASLTIRDSLLQSTPLGWACRWGHIELARLYLARGADPVEADAEPWARPLAWATKRGHHEIIELLQLLSRC